LSNAKRVDHWYQLAGLDVETGDTSRALMIIGDYITEGFGVQPNTDQRWTDFLIARVQNDPELKNTLAVLNAGLGGNRVLVDGLGPNGLARFDRDVVNRPGARHVIVLLGVNDLGTLSRDEAAGQRDYDELVDRLIAAFDQMTARARENGIQIIGATIMPFAGSSFYPSNEMAEAARQKVNAWIRKPGSFDAIIDFDSLMRSPDDPSRLNPALDSGDHLHPSIAGYQAMAEFVSLDLFK
jgi:lysophospholipase L1-like esterase